MKSFDQMLSTLCLVPIFTAYRQMVLLIVDTSKMSFFLVVYLDHRAELVDRRVYIANKFFPVRRPCGGDAKGLFECLKQAVKYVGLPNEWNKNLIGFGCDGTSVNIGDRGLKTYLQQTAP